MNSAFWDERFAEPGGVYGTEPNDFLRQQSGVIKTRGRVLCVGEGEGRNAVWLAGRGFDVHAADYSRVGLRRIEELAASRGVEVRTTYADLATYRPSLRAYDAVVSIFVHLPEAARAFMHDQALHALVPGGAFVAEYFSVEQLGYDSGGPRNPAMLYTKELLEADVRAAGCADIKLLEQQEVELREGRYHQGPASVIRLVAVAR